MGAEKGGGKGMFGRLFGAANAETAGATGATAPRPGVVAVVAPGTASTLPRVSIVILNYNGRHHLAGCFESLAALDYPRERFEVILVDNGSIDGSVEEMRARHGWVRLIENAHNAGFSAGCNQGARAALEPDVLVFLNNDMRVERDWLTELVAPLVAGVCQATKMLSWDGKLMNSAGGGMNFYGIGIQKGYLEEPGPKFDQQGRSLFACGGAMAVLAEVYFDAGGFDDEFFAYYEDVDLGWRLWVQGHEVHYAPKSVCYHHHSSTSRTFPVETIRLLQVRNPFLACFKNYGEEHLRQVLPAQLALAVRRMFILAGLGDTHPFRIESTQAGGRGVVGRLWERARHAANDTVPISRVAAADLIGINDLLGRFDHWTARRAAVQAKRRRPDGEIFALFHKPLWCIEGEAGYEELQRGLVSMFGIDRLFAGLEATGADPHK